MKKLIITTLTLFCFISLQAQFFCERFDQNMTTGIITNGIPATVVYNLLNNWGTQCANLQYTDVQSQNGSGDVFLKAFDVGCSDGGSWMFNNIDYSGDWTQFADNCFCYDYRIFFNGNSTPNPPNSLYIFNGPDPFSSTLLARFVLNNAIGIADGWVTLCAPTGLSDGTNIPSNSIGHWEMVVGSGAADWDALITNIGGVGYNLDIGSSPSEVYGFDNICVQECGDCATVVDDVLNCDASGYTYTFTVKNNTGLLVDGIIVNGVYDPLVNIPNGGAYGPITITIPAGSTEHCFNIIMFSENLECCHYTHCIDLPLCNPCDSIDLVSHSIDTDDGACCYEVDVINNFDDQYFTKIVSTILTLGVNFDNPTGDNGWTVSPTTGNTLTWTPPTTYIDDITDLGVLNFCFKDIVHISQTPQVVTFDWVITNAAGQDSIVCTDTLSFYCEPCLVIEEKSVTCLDDGTYDYCFSITNNSNNLATQLYFDPYAPVGVVFNPNPLNISLPGMSTQTLCVNLSGVSAGDIIDYKAILKNFTGDTLNWCCIVDTFSVVIPPCETGPCPQVQDYIVDCTDDLDGDGQPEYILQLYIDGVGTVYPSSGCGTISPSSMSVAGPGFYSFTVYNTGNCNPFPLQFYTTDAQGVICSEGLFQVNLPECPPIQGCICDESFFDNVGLGFNHVFNCPDGIFTTPTLEACDKIEWSINGEVVGSSAGNGSFTYTYPSVGQYEVCMTVIRVDVNGVECKKTFCTLIVIDTWCLLDPNDDLDPIEISPNPAQNFIYINLDDAIEAGSFKVRILNATGGQLIRLQNVSYSGGQIELDLSKLENGLYLLRVEGENYTSAYQKFINLNN